MNLSNHMIVVNHLVIENDFSSLDKLFFKKFIQLLVSFFIFLRFMVEKTMPSHVIPTHSLLIYLLSYLVILYGTFLG